MPLLYFIAKENEVIITYENFPGVIGCYVNLNQKQMAVNVEDLDKNLPSSQIYGGAESVLLDH